MAKRLIFRRIRGRIVPITIGGGVAASVISSETIRESVAVSAASFAAANTLDALIRIGRTNRGRKMVSRIVMKGGRKQPIRDFGKMFTRNKRFLAKAGKRGLIIGTGVGMATGTVRTLFKKKRGK